MYERRAIITSSLFRHPEDQSLEQRPEFARTSDEAHERIMESLAGDEAFEILARIIRCRTSSPRFPLHPDRQARQPTGPPAPRTRDGYRDSGRGSRTRRP